jgi:hypothetical protein
MEIRRMSTDTTSSCSRPEVTKESALIISLAGVSGGESRPAEDRLGIAKIDAVLFSD